MRPTCSMLEMMLQITIRYRRVCLLGCNPTGVLCPSSGDLSESELLVRSLRGLDSWRSFMGVLTRFCRGVRLPSSLEGETIKLSQILGLKLGQRFSPLFPLTAQTTNITNVNNATSKNRPDCYGLKTMGQYMFVFRPYHNIKMLGLGNKIKYHNIPLCQY